MLQKTQYAIYVHAWDQTIGAKRAFLWDVPPNRDVSETKDYMDKHGIQYMIYWEDAYPTNLLACKPLSYVIYVQWCKDVIQTPLLAIVWPRYMSNYARRILDDLFALLPAYHLATISGGANGVDIYVHESSLSHNIPTIAVLGGWIAYYHQTGKTHLLGDIIKAWWAIISEYALFQKPQRYTFPQRNRIIAGLSTVLFLPEAGEGSGSLLTADWGIKYKKPIYAPMGDIYALWSKGTNAYICKNSITPVCDIRAFLDSHFEKRPYDEQPERVWEAKHVANYATDLGNTLIQDSLRELGL